MGDTTDTSEEVTPRPSTPEAFHASELASYQLRLRQALGSDLETAARLVDELHADLAAEIARRRA